MPHPHDKVTYIPEREFGSPEWYASRWRSRWYALEEEVKDLESAILSNLATLANQGPSLGFDGDSGYIKLSKPLTVDFDSGFTVEVWVRYTSFKRWSRIIDFGNGPKMNNIFLGNEGVTNDLIFQVWDDGKKAFELLAKGVLQIGVWLHLAATIDQNGVATLYCNGKMVAQKQGVLPSSAIREKNYVGRSHWVHDHYFLGDMRELSLWKTARTRIEIERDMASLPPEEQPDLVGHWPLQDGAGTIALDLTNNKNHGQLLTQFHEPNWHNKDHSATRAAGNEAAPEKATGSTLHVDTSLVFNGVKDYVELLEPVQLDFSMGFTVEVWVYFETLTKSVRIIDFGNGSEPDTFLLSVHSKDPTALHFRVYNDAGGRKTSKATGVLKTDTWLHLAVTVDTSGTTQIYCNGIFSFLSQWFFWHRSTTPA